MTFHEQNQIHSHKCIKIILAFKGLGLNKSLPLKV